MKRGDHTLDKILRHAVETVPRYKGIFPELEKFPILGKVDIVHEIDSHLSTVLGSLLDLTSQALQRSDEFKYAWKTAEISQNGVMFEETTGTSGIPFRFIRSVAERSKLAIGIWQYRKSIDPLVSTRNFYPFFHRGAVWQDRFDPLEITTENIDSLYADLNRRGVRWIHCFPNMLLRHANAISSPLVESHSLKFAEISGAFTSNEVLRIAKSQLGVRVVNQYGIMEVLAMGFGNTSESFEVLDNNVYIELISDAGNPIEDPHIEGEIVVTSKHQYLFPFIRYKTGDRASWSVPGRKIIMRDLNRDYEDGEKWKTWKSGGRYFRVMALRAMEITGFQKIKFLQIREQEDFHFLIRVSAIGDPVKLKLAFVEACEKYGLIKAPTFSIEVIDEQELRALSQQKPQLFVALRKPTPRGCQ